MIFNESVFIEKWIWLEDIEISLRDHESTSLSNLFVITVFSMVYFGTDAVLSEVFS